MSYTSLGNTRLLRGGLQMGTFTVCKSGRHAVDVVLAHSGRARIQRTAATSAPDVPRVRSSRNGARAAHAAGRRAVTVRSRKAPLVGIVCGLPGRPLGYGHRKGEFHAPRRVAHLRICMPDSR